MKTRNPLSMWLLTLAAGMCVSAGASAQQSLGAQSIEYAYDADGRLICAVYAGATPVTVTYQYDASGNVLRRTVAEGFSKPGDTVHADLAPPGQEDTRAPGSRPWGRIASCLALALVGGAGLSRRQPKSEAS